MGVAAPLHGTVVLVGEDCEHSVTAVLGELAEAARSLLADGVTVDALLVTTSTEAVRAAHAGAATVGLALTALEPAGHDAWSTQRLAFEHALAAHSCDFLVTLDPAGHHDARQLPDLVRSFIATSSGVTVGSRWMRGGQAPGTSFGRGLLSRLASRLVATATGLRRIHDVTTSFRVIKPEVAALVPTDPAAHGDYGFYCEFIAAAQAYGFTVTEVPITFRPRFTAVAPLRGPDLIEFAGDLRRIRRRIASLRSEMQIDQATWAARSGRMRAQDDAVGSQFGALDELVELRSAHRFTRWIVEALEPAIGDQVVEVGAGLGAVCSLVAAGDPSRNVLAIEPADNVFATLADRAHQVANLEVRQITSRQLADEQPGAFDTVLYVNVLEHIADDVGELRTAAQLLRPGGAVGIFVPAMPALYGSLDFKSGHHRRYTRDGLSEAVTAAGFRLDELRHMDPLGAVPYWVMYRALDVDRLDRVSSAGYDRVVVPLSRAAERIVRRPPFGKNLVAIARRA